MVVKERVRREREHDLADRRPTRHWQKKKNRNKNYSRFHGKRMKWNTTRKQYYYLTVEYGRDSATFGRYSGAVEHVHATAAIERRRRGWQQTRLLGETADEKLNVRDPVPSERQRSERRAIGGGGGGGVIHEPVAHTEWGGRRIQFGAFINGWARRLGGTVVNTYRAFDFYYHSHGRASSAEHFCFRVNFRHIASKIRHHAKPIRKIECYKL